MPWILLSVAIVAEVLATIALRASDAFKNLVPSLAAISGYVIAFYLLALVQRSLPASTVYAVWAAAGTAAMAVIGMTWLGEPATTLRIASVSAIVAGVIGLGAAGGTGTH